MAMRNTGSLLTIALLAACAYLILPRPGCDSFVAPRVASSSSAAGDEPSAL
eukprot:CAMPEP_0113834890 /NCGR_PEP_ID=MMETSP0328-20130328/8657_1 /TAXON_ID=39455 /ORGANISM="Alexandrium minutum" /LENGTH=50 /DNA_ID=CAMNT_0000803207 /DNA_START=112 /DNA_END=260 /DNA_ORIENTATION=- /assembly_acc=CAM_ASM_000350